MTPYPHIRLYMYVCHRGESEQSRILTDVEINLLLVSKGIDPDSVTKHITGNGDEDCWVWIDNGLPLIAAEMDAVEAWDDDVLPWYSGLKRLVKRVPENFDRHANLLGFVHHHQNNSYRNYSTSHANDALVIWIDEVGFPEPYAVHIGKRGESKRWFGPCFTYRDYLVALAKVNHEPAIEELVKERVSKIDNMLI